MTCPPVGELRNLRGRRGELAPSARDQTGLCPSARRPFLEKFGNLSRRKKCENGADFATRACAYSRICLAEAEAPRVREGELDRERLQCNRPKT
jgi:hypothetical protein